MTAVLAIEALRATHGENHDVVRGFSLALGAGATFGPPGESGCGEATFAYAPQRHLPKGGRLTGGRVSVECQDVYKVRNIALRRLRAETVSVAYRDPATALNPSMRVGRQLHEADATAWRPFGEQVRRGRDPRRPGAGSAPEPGIASGRWPHPLSGGLLQRVVTAMALLLRPKLLILGEATTGCDATVEAVVAGLISGIARESGWMAAPYISRNFGLPAHVAEPVGVMCAGELVEGGPVGAVLKSPAHPYTRALLDCVPRHGPDRRQEALIPVPGQVPHRGDLPEGGSLAPRCGYAGAGPCNQPTGLAMVTASKLGRLHNARCRRLGPVQAESPRLDALPGPTEPSRKTLLELHGVSRVFRPPGPRRSPER